jgi:hypothetical protein
MFTPNSRYYKMATATTGVTGSDGVTRTVRYVQRRIISPINDGLNLTEHTITEGERLDLLADHYLGDSTQFWQLCDVNNVLRPQELTEQIGRSITITLPL